MSLSSICGITTFRALWSEASPLHSTCEAAQVLEDHAVVRLLAFALQRHVDVIECEERDHHHVLEQRLPGDVDLRAAQRQEARLVEAGRIGDPQPAQAEVGGEQPQAHEADAGIDAQRVAGAALDGAADDLVDVEGDGGAGGQEEYDQADEDSLHGGPPAPTLYPLPWDSAAAGRSREDLPPGIQIMAAQPAQPPAWRTASPSTGARLADQTGGLEPPQGSIATPS
jgi:hypothetical protein